VHVGWPAFIVGLQTDFPSTVDALSRTVEKMTAPPPDAAAGKQHLCALCELPLALGARTWRAAIVVRTPAPSDAGPPTPVDAGLPNGDGTNNSDGEDEDALCYGCQTTLADRRGPLTAVLPPNTRVPTRSAVAELFLSHDDDDNDDNEDAPAGAA
jgi:hypothetical protein